jgi:ABC-type branched-subunit amino acid transport system substrate-binding protein
MKVRRLFIGALGVMALASVTVFGATSSAQVAKVAAAKCSASLAIEAPFTGPVAQLGLEQGAGAKAAVAADNKSLGIHVTLGQDDTQLTPALAVTKTAAIISSNAVAVIGPSGSQEVAATGPALATAGLAAISGSATNPTLTTTGANSTFFRTVATDAVQGPQDANYILKHLKPKAVLIVEDEELYSTGLGGTIAQLLTAAGVTVNVQSFNGQDSGATLANDLSSIVNAQLNAAETVTVMPIQEAADAQQFASDAKQAGKTTLVFGTDGTDSSSQFFFPGSLVSNFAPDISTVKNSLDSTITKQIKKAGTYGPFGVPSYVAADVEMRAIAAVCKAGKKPSRSNVLAAIRKTSIPAKQNPLGQLVKFKGDGDLTTSQFYLFKINAGGKYIQISSK